MSGHFDIWLLKYQKKGFSSKFRYLEKLSYFHIYVKIQRKISSIAQKAVKGQIFWLYFENKSLKLNLRRKSLKLFFSELGNIFSEIFTIIWAFTAFLAINSKEIRSKIKSIP